VGLYPIFPELENVRNLWKKADELDPKGPGSRPGARLVARHDRFPESGLDSGNRFQHVEIRATDKDGVSPRTIGDRNQLRRVEYQGSAADVTRGVEFHEKDLLSS